MPHREACPRSNGNLCREHLSVVVEASSFVWSSVCLCLVSSRFVFGDDYRQCCFSTVRLARIPGEIGSQKGKGYRVGVIYW